jgi:glucose-6-phosphate dehydrogenase assembly protein OpcA
MGTTLVGKTVAPEKILKELSALWVAQGKEGEGANAAGVLRACSMTLVVLAETGDDRAALGETIAALMPEHPARALVIHLSGAGPRALTERVTQQCWKPFGKGPQICCEQVEITASDAALADLPLVLLPLVVADLPVIVWCRSPRLLQMAEFGEIARMATKVVMDSAGFVDTRGLADGAAVIGWMADATRHGLTIGDLSWTRLTRWREMLSHVFENRDYLAKLSRISDVRVEFAGELGVSAWLMGAWVANALADAGVQAALRVEKQDGAAAPPSLRMELAGPGVRVELARQGERLVITVNHLSNCTNLPQPSDYLLMREELGIVRRDAVFERSLVSAARLAYATDK